MGIWRQGLRLSHDLNAGGVPDQSLSSFFSDLDDVDFDAIAFGSGPNNPVEDGLLEDYHSDSLYP